MYIYMVYVVTCRGVPGICTYIWYMWLHVGGYLVYVHIYGICSYT